MQCSDPQGPPQDRRGHEKEVITEMSEEQKNKQLPEADANEASVPVNAPDTDGEAKAEKKAGQPTAADLLKSDIDLNVRKAKGSKNVTTGVVTILATFNNTKVCFTDVQGNVISWSSAGKMNFRGSRKSTAYAAQVVTQDAGKVALSHGMREVEVRVKGPGMGRDSAIRAVQSLGMNVTAIVDVTPVPHNGCRPKKRRRV
ncbi:MAG: hypothetical protein RL648_1600 [Verrucomicrobiota bacterium]|jgi:small subunit ribosomal protein S11